MTKVRFKIKYEPKFVDDMSVLMRSLDLGIGGVTMPIEEIVSWKTSTPVDKKYISDTARLLKKGLIDAGCTPIYVKRLLERKEQI